MYKDLKNAVLIFVVFTLLLGLVYPLVITGISQVAFPTQANGNLIYENGTLIGSALIGQNFSSPIYFQGRPSAVDYNASDSGGSNYGPTNQKFITLVAQNVQNIRTEDNLSSTAVVPADLVLASGSGLEGYIYLDSAMIQAPRIAKARGISESEVVDLINANAENTFFGTGQEIVNVLKLNIALNQLKK